MTNSPINNLSEIHEKAVSEVKRNRSLLAILGSCIDIFPYMCWTKDLDYKFTSVNSELLDTLFLTKDRTKLIGKRRDEVIEEIKSSGIPYEYHSCRESDNLVLERDSTGYFFERISINDRIVYIYTMKSPLYVDGKLCGVVGISYNITNNVMPNTVFNELKHLSSKGIVDMSEKYNIKYYFEEIKG